MNRFCLKKFALVSVALGIITNPLIAIAQTNSESLPTTAESNQKLLQIQAISHNIKNSQIAVGDTLTITIKGTAEARASILLIADKQQVREYNAREIRSGVYIANITLTQRDRFIEGAIMARLQKGSQAIYSAVEQSFAVNSTTNEPTSSLNPETPSTITPERQNVSLPLTITSHQNGESIGSNGVTIQGQTEPNAEIQIKIASSKALVGNIIQIEGDTLIEQIVNADNNGKFAITIPATPTTTKGLQYQITAIAVNQNSQSRLVQLTLIQK